MALKETESGIENLTQVILHGLRFHDHSNEGKTGDDAVELFHGDYNLIRSYLNGLLEGKDLIPFIRQEIQKKISMFESAYGKTNFFPYKTTLDCLRNFLSAPDDLVVEALEKSKPRLSSIVNVYLQYVLDDTSMNKTQ